MPLMVKCLVNPCFKGLARQPLLDRSIIRSTTYIPIHFISSVSALPNPSSNIVFLKSTSLDTCTINYSRSTEFSIKSYSGRRDLQTSAFRRSEDEDKFAELNPGSGSKDAISSNDSKDPRIQFYANELPDKLTSISEAISGRDLNEAFAIWRDLTLNQENVKIDDQLALIQALSISKKPDSIVKLKEVLEGILSNLERDGWDQFYFDELLRLINNTNLPGLSARIFEMLTDGSLSSKLLLGPFTSTNLVRLACAEADARTLLKLYTFANEAQYTFGTHEYIKMIKLFEDLSNMSVVDDIVAKVSAIPNFMDLPLYSAAMAAYARNCHVDAVLQLFSNLKKHGLKPDLFIFSSVICGLGNVGRIPEMLQQLESMAKYKLEPDVAIINSIMRTQLPDADQVLARFTELTSDPMLQPDSYTFNCLILLHLQRDDLASARAVRDQMISSGVAPTWVTFAQFIGHFAKTHDLPKAFQTLDELKEAGVNVNASILNLMVELCIDAGEFERACKLIDDSPHVTLDIVTHTLLMRHHAKNKDHERVLQHFNVIKRLDLPMSAIAYDVVFHSMVQTKDSKMLLSTFHDMVNSHCILPDTTIVNTIMRGLVLGPNPAEAPDFFKHVVKHHSESAPPNIATYNLLLSAYLRIGNSNLAAQLVDHMVSLGQSGFPDLLPDNQTWSQLLWAYAKSKDTKTLEECFKRFSEPPFSLRPSPQVFEALIMGYFATRDLVKAKRIFQLSTRQKSQTTPKMLSLYVSILGAEGSLTALQREWLTLPERFSPDVAAHRWVYIAYLQALVKCGGYQEAVDVFAGHSHRGLYNNKAAISVLSKALRARRRAFELKELESHVAMNYPTLLHAMALK